MKPELTDWYPRNILPHWYGFYEIDWFDEFKVAFFVGENWYCQMDSMNDFQKLQGNYPWRGIKR
tara:strand:- start:225 stop:416 length:192 start_codon:yes stop_codon:yes gene_type:complete